MAANRRSIGARAGRSPTPLDETDRRLLAELQEDARLSFAELGRRVGLSSPAVAERVARLEQDRVITGYRAQTARVRDVEHLEEVIDRFASFGQTTTSIVQSIPVALRGLALDPATTNEKGSAPTFNAR
jgi:Lrp/AsnC family leucine-responsive transcriptional regulator